MSFTVEVQSIAQLQRTLAFVRDVAGVFEAARR
jgi:hypothetical protein